MAAKLYTDVHVPSAVTLGLRIRGIDVLTSQQDGTTEFSDEDLLPNRTSARDCRVVLRCGRGSDPVAAEFW